MFVLYYVVMARGMAITSINHLYLSKDRRINTTKGSTYTQPNPCIRLDATSDRKKIGKTIIPMYLLNGYVVYIIVLNNYYVNVNYN